MDFKKNIALIQEVLKSGLSHIKPKPKIWIEVHEGGYGLRVWVISKGFAKMSMTDRYHLVFSLFNQDLAHETQSNISSLLIYTPKEMHYDMPWERPAQAPDEIHKDPAQLSDEATPAFADSAS